MENKTDDELKWNINIRDERNYWINQLIEKFLKIPKQCLNCSRINLNQIENKSLNNPILYKCSNCGKIIYLRPNSFFGLFPLTPASLIHKVINMWLIDEKNATKIYKAIINNTNIHLSTDQTICNIFLKIRLCIAHYIRDKYELEILAEENNNRTIAID